MLLVDSRERRCRMARLPEKGTRVMTKSLTFVVLASLMLVAVGCASDPPQQKSADAVVTPLDTGSVDGHWMVPISFPN